MMKISQDIIDELDHEYKTAISNLSVNCAIFRFRERSLEVATVDFAYANLTVIPGGFVNKKEDVTEAVRRLVTKQTSLNDLLIREVGIFGDTKRSFKNEYNAFRVSGIPDRLVDWLSERFVSFAYYSILDDREIEAEVEDVFFTRLNWLSVNEIDKLHLDHKSIVTKALRKLAMDILAEPVLKGLLPSQFTMPTLHALYEAILDRSIDKGNFRQSILKSKILKKVGTQDKQNQGRPADIYTFNDQIYLSSLSTEQKLGF